MSKIRVSVMYLGGSRGESGCSNEHLNLPEGATVQDVQNAVINKHEKLRARISSVRWALNHEFADLCARVEDGDEVALLPPVAGGSPAGAPDETRFSIQDVPIDCAQVVGRVSEPRMGAVVTFVGTVRNFSRNRAVRALIYEAYEPMASRQLVRIGERVELDHGGIRVAVSHRTGHLKVGEQSVVIAVASPHREAAFLACRDTLEALKKDLPIWKREIYVDGEDWVGWGGG